MEQLRVAKKSRIGRSGRTENRSRARSKCVRSKRPGRWPSSRPRFLPRMRPSRRTARERTVGLKDRLGMERASWDTASMLHHTHTHTPTHPHIHTPTHPHTHTPTHPHIHVQRHTPTHPHTHTSMCKGTHKGRVRVQVVAGKRSEQGASTS